MGKCNIEIIRQTASGQVYRCLSCQRIHVEFNNLYFTFTDKEYLVFRKYFLELDGSYWENKCQESSCRRKIKIACRNGSFIALFNAAEILELKNLLSKHPDEKLDQEMVSCSDIMPFLPMN